ncbi:MAG TPA: penicillin-binding transpeptidase domain-containing protein [bacterium]|nr:penicillin-binding transpeptidase domain-containing protein [bacterium]
MLRRTRNVGRLLAGLFAVLLAYLAFVQVIWGPQLAASPQNPRLALAAERIHWGRILDRRLTVLADSVGTGPLQVRRYPQGAAFAHVLGYRSRRYGLTGIERREDLALLGLPITDPWEVLQEAFGRTPEGNDVVLTLDAGIQQAAVRALGNVRGAVVVLDPRTGAVLALVSRPGFDPSAVDAQWAVLSRDASAPLYDRATQGQYPPGSSFKTVTLTAALGSGRVHLADPVRCPEAIDVGGALIHNFEHEQLGQISVLQAFVASCNTAFVQIGQRTGAQAVAAAARAFGLGQPVPFDLPTSSGYVPPPRDLGARGLAQIAFGQGSLLVTPLQMALVAAAVGNGGTMMTPFLVSQIRAPDGRIRQTFTQRGSRNVMAASLAGEVAQAMVQVVQSGTGTAAQLPGVLVAGKTGTAENPHGNTHAWFIAFAPADRPVVALSVIVENGGVGGQVAAPIARQVLAAALQIQSAAAGRP